MADIQGGYQVVKPVANKFSKYCGDYGSEIEQAYSIEVSVSHYGCGKWHVFTLGQKRSLTKVFIVESKKFGISQKNRNLCIKAYNPSEGENIIAETEEDGELDYGEKRPEQGPPKR